ncbi:unnamed protein product [Lactuca saligna]|uniref:K Homology domain-containing protein n=1 Tax=Lactuca saligna TaxID=75948 RepID=A0AA36ENU5_LACSI|nr:unnamed protein product [Lactuca saligna]
MVEEAKMNEETFLVRLLVVYTQVGCLLGKSGGLIKQMASESREQIRILPRDKIPACASSSDELVQVPDEQICAPQDAVLRVQTRIFRAAPETKPVTTKVIMTAKVIEMQHMEH